MTEQKLQSDIVRKFSELYPEKRGQLFHVSNERNNQKQAFIAQSIGIVPGVSDLIYFEPSYRELFLHGIELKVKGSTHKVSHIESQLRWAKTLEDSNGYWSLCRTIDEAINFIEGKPNDGLSIQEVEEMLKNNGSKKTIKF